jgi:2-polyprenyl-3-methyl-5-hydroxy-6-metoxy-1,4-benzoquinol methylase
VSAEGPEVPATAAGRNEAVRAAWEANAAFWDERMGEGNAFHRLLLARAIERLLEPRSGMRVLEAACGNGNLARRLADLGAEVVAFDFAAAMVERARERSTAYQGRIEYCVVDATDEAALATLGPAPFDALVCNMALMDMAAIEPLIAAGRRLLSEGGAFVFSVCHPCFNSLHTRFVAEGWDDASGALRTEHSVRLTGYKTGRVSRGIAMAGQPEAQLYFHRPLEELLGAFFRQGYVLDGLLEPTFPPETRSGEGLGWGSLPDIPPVIVCRLRSPGAAS